MSKDYCVEFSPEAYLQKNKGRRQSNSWDNDAKQHELLALPASQDRRNSHTLAQLMECVRRLSVASDEDPTEIDGEIVEKVLIQPPHRGSNSRRASIAEISDQGIATKSSDDCVVLTQTLGTSTTYFFQKDPTAQNLNLRPSAVERGLYNFDEKIKESPKIVRLLDTPRPSIQLSSSTKPFVHITSTVTIPENEPTTDDISLRPTLTERGLPRVKFPNFSQQQQPPPTRGRTLEKQPRISSRLGNEFDTVISNRRKILEAEEARRENSNLIRPRNSSSRPLRRPHQYDGRSPTPVGTAGNLMEELRSHIDGGEVDRIVKEKKTTTLTPNGVPISVNNPNRQSLTDGVPPNILDRPYVRATPQERKSPSTSEKTDERR